VIVVVSNTSPINYLILIKYEHVLPALFGSVLVPPAVVAELSRAESPEAVRTWIENPPSWLVVRAATVIDPTIGLHLGEREAIALAEEVQAARILLDDKHARRIATQRGLKVVGTLAVLSEASERGLLSLDQALSDLGETNFRVDASLIEFIRRRTPRAPPLEH
jgi:predicted nucleic acid-binding protein